MSKSIYDEALEARQALHMIERSVGEHEWFRWEEVETLEDAINELEELRKRNEPMKPKYEKDGTRSCPTCNANWLTPNFKYCSDCGQKLDWGKENDK